MRFTVALLLMFSLLGCSGDGRDSAAPELDDFLGQWVVINYWAQWCAPCIKEIPELNELDAQYAEVTVLGVNYDGATGEELNQQRQKLAVAFANLGFDPAAQLGISRPAVLPTTLVLNPSGELVATLVGPQTLASLAAATEQVPSDDLD